MTKTAQLRVHNVTCLLSWCRKSTMHMYKELVLFRIPPCFYTRVTIFLPKPKLRHMNHPHYPGFPIPSSYLEDEDLLLAPPAPTNLLERPIVLNPVKAPHRSHKSSKKKSGSRSELPKNAARRYELLAITEEVSEAENAQSQGTSDLRI